MQQLGSFLVSNLYYRELPNPVMPLITVDDWNAATADVQFDVTKWQICATQLAVP